MCSQGCPGEKLYEELLADDETTEPTPHPKLRIAKVAAGIAQPAEVLEWVNRAGPEADAGAIRQWLQAMVPEYVRQA